MTSDVVERNYKDDVIAMLRAQIRELGHMPCVVENDEAARQDKRRMNDLVSEISRLRKEVGVLREALEPFVTAFNYDPGHSDLDNEQPINVRVQLGDWRRANRTLAALSQVPKLPT